MKNSYRLIALLLTVLLLAGLFGCNRQQPQQPQQPSEEDQVQPQQPQQPEDPEPTEDPEPQQPQQGGVLQHQRLERQEVIKNDQGVELVSLSLVVPQVAQYDSITEYYNDWLSDTAYYIDQQKETAQEAYEFAQEGFGVFQTYVIESDYEVVRNDGVVFTVLRDCYENTGGAHPSYAIMTENFISDSGKLLLLDDVFTVSQQVYDQRIRQMVLEQTKDRVVEYGVDPYYEGFEDTLMEVFDRSDFCLTPDGLMVFWPTYTIAPYVAGIQQFTLPYGELSDIMDARWVVE